MLDADRLARELVALLDDPDRRLAMATAAREQGRPDAAAAIVDDLFTWIAGPPMTAARVPSIPPPSGDPEPGMAFARVDFRAARGELAMARASSRPPPPVRFEPAALPFGRALAS